MTHTDETVHACDLHAVVANASLLHVVRADLPPMCGVARHDVGISRQAGSQSNESWLEVSAVRA